MSTLIVEDVNVISGGWGGAGGRVEGVGGRFLWGK